jgi:type IV secretion system protein VirB10
MFEQNNEPPVATDERTGMVERKSLTPPGQRLIMVTTAVVAAGAILFGIASKNNYFGIFGAPNVPKDAKQEEPRPVSAPALTVPLAVASPAPSFVQCSGGLRLPNGMSCPEAPGASAPGPGAAMPAMPVEAKGPTVEQMIAARRQKGDINVAAGQAVSQRGTGAALVSTPQALPGASTPTGGTNALAGALQGTNTPSVTASAIRNPSLTLAKGTLPDCTLVTAIRTDQPGFLKCILGAPVMSMDGNVTLLDTGTTMEGEYTQGVQAGQKAIFTLWTRAVTPNFVTVQLNSPGTDPLGRAGTDGYIDNKWLERFSGAVFFSLFEDLKEYAIAREEQRAALRTAAAGNGGTTYNIGTQGLLSQLNNTGSTTKSIVEEMLKQGSQVKPSLYKNQGEVIRIYVARDVDFSSVYELQRISPQ